MFLSNYYYRYTRPIDFEFYKRLRKPIAKSLYTLLENGWFAAEGKPYRKFTLLCVKNFCSPNTAISLISRSNSIPHMKSYKNWGFWKDGSIAKRRWDGLHYRLLPREETFFDDQGTKDTRRQLANQIEASKFPSPNLISSIPQPFCFPTFSKHVMIGRIRQRIEKLSKSTQGHLSGWPCLKPTKLTLKAASKNSRRVFYSRSQAPLSISRPSLTSFFSPYPSLAVIPCG